MWLESNVTVTPALLVEPMLTFCYGTGDKGDPLWGVCFCCLHYKSNRF